MFEEIARDIEQKLSLPAMFDPRWYKGCGRVVVACGEQLQPEQIASSMLQIIESTLAKVTARYSNSVKS